MLSLDDLAWEKGDGLLPAVVQDADEGRVLMLGYMNAESLGRTLETGRVTFWSRSRSCMWTKGETSGNHLELIDWFADCDADCLLVRARPVGPICHRGTASCFDGESVVAPPLAFLATLERVIASRDKDRPENSYTTQLFSSSVQRMAQKVGEEGVETALAGTSGSDAELASEAADLLFHLLVLLRARGLGLSDVIRALESRNA